MLVHEAKIQATHVPYKGAALAITDLLGDRLDFMFDTAPVIPHIKANKLRLLAVARGTSRWPAALPVTLRHRGHQWLASTNNLP